MPVATGLGPFRKRDLVEDRLVGEFNKDLFGVVESGSKGEAADPERSERGEPLLAIGRMLSLQILTNWREALAILMARLAMVLLLS